jgi:hypothetical protein
MYTLQDASSRAFSCFFNSVEQLVKKKQHKKNHFDNLGRVRFLKNAIAGGCMNFKFSYGFFFSLCALTTLFGNNFQSQVILDSIQCVQEIIKEAPEIIKQKDGDRVYLEEGRMYPAGKKSCLLLANRSSIPIHTSLIFFDNRYGPYLSLSQEIMTKKLFKNVCYDCKYEWEGGFSIRCPRCGSANIGNEPNW